MNQRRAEELELSPQREEKPEIEGAPSRVNGVVDVPGLQLREEPVSLRQDDTRFPPGPGKLPHQAQEDRLTPSGSTRVGEMQDPDAPHEGVQPTPGSGTTLALCRKGGRCGWRAVARTAFRLVSETAVVSPKETQKIG